MANAGPNTMEVNFLSLTSNPWLDGKHSVFGNVIEGQSIVDSVSNGDKIHKIEIIRIGNDAEKFDEVKVFESGLS